MLAEAATLCISIVALNRNVLCYFNIQGVLNVSNLHFWDEPSAKSSLVNPRLWWPLTSLHFTSPPPLTPHPTPLTPQPNTQLRWHALNRRRWKPQDQSACNEACSNMSGGLAESLIPQEATDMMPGKKSKKNKRSKVSRRDRTGTLSSRLVWVIFIQVVLFLPRPKSILIQGDGVSNLQVKMHLSVKMKLEKLRFYNL